MILWQNQCKYVMERMDRAIHKTAWSQLKAKFLQVYVLQMGCVVYRKTCILRMRMPLSLCKLCCNEDRSPAKSANVQQMGYVVQGPVCCNLGSCGLMYHTLAHHMCCKVGPGHCLERLCCNEQYVAKDPGIPMGKQTYSICQNKPLYAAKLRYMNEIKITLVF